MRSTIDIDEKLLKEAMSVSHFATKRQLINAGLRELVRTSRIERLIGRFGKAPLKLSLKDIHKMRQDD